jgi:nicotinate phosphoribosyltransferase
LEKCLTYRKELGWTSTVLNELYAFIAYAVAYPKAYNALVDSYSTKTSGCLNFIIVSLALSDLGY